MSAAKQSKKRRAPTARGNVATSATKAIVATSATKGRATKKRAAAEPHQAQRKSPARRSTKTRAPKASRSAPKHGVGDQIVDYVRTAALRLSQLPLARTLERDARRLYDVLLTQERQVDRVVRWQLNRWLTLRSPQRLGAVKNALQKLDVRRLPVANSR